MMTRIHPTAIVSKDAEIGQNVEIGPYCIVDGNTKIGDGTVLRGFVHVCNYTEMGKNCTIYDHAVIGGDPQDLSYKGEISWAKIGDGVVCREYVTINRASGEGEETLVGDKCFIMEGVHVAHNVKIGRECTIANKAGLSGHVQVGDYAVIGGMTGFHQFVHIGSYCMIGGMSRVNQDVPPYCLAVGSPLRVYDINRVGLRRRGFDTRTRSQIREMYKLIYDPHTTVREGIAEVARRFQNDSAAKLILDFAAEATRGFAPRVTQDWKAKDDGQID